MSASFLVSPEGRAWLIGIGSQRMEIRNGRFEYQGGEIPAAVPVPIAQVRRAVDAIEGLRGFVGVDFIWDDASRQATVLEINPRPTTSLRRAMPALAGRAVWPGPGSRRVRPTARRRRAARESRRHWFIPKTPVVSMPRVSLPIFSSESTNEQRTRSRSGSLDRPRHRRGQHQGRPQPRPGVTVPSRSGSGPTSWGGRSRARGDTAPLAIGPS